MAVEHRKRSRQAKRVAIVATATATVSALTVGAAPAPVPEKRASDAAVDLSAVISLLPKSDQVPDITGGLGTAIYDGNQAIADSLIRAVVNGINIAALAQAAGLDPQSLLTGLLADIPSSLLPGILAQLSVDLPILGPVLQGLDLSILTNLLASLGLSEVTDAALTGLLALIGYNLSDPLNLGNLDIPGLNIITAGPTFSALKMLGLDLGWVPALPNSVANEINNSDYLEVGAAGVLQLIRDRLGTLGGGPLDPILGGLLGGVLTSLNLPSLGALLGVVDDLIGSADPITGLIPDLVHLRITPTIGIGIGAFAAAMAYEKVIADLPFQPGGASHPFGENPLLGSITLLPMVLINNPARPDGGALARFGALGALFGINTVNPRTEVTGSGGFLDGPLGLHIGGSNVIPILVDATYEYQPLSDLASWPNAFTLTNNLAAALSPTYMLRGLSLNGLADQLLAGVGDAVDLSLLTGDPLAINLYLTLQSKTLPMLEPLYLASDFLNLIGLAPLAQIPMRIANALAPALTILTNIGYSNVVQNPDGTYTRDFTNSGVETPFLSFANIDYGRALSDSFNALIGGIQKELGPNPTPGTPNVLKTLLDAILGGGLGGVLPGTTPAPGTGTPSTGNPITDLLGGLLGPGGLLGGLFGGLGLPTAAPSTLAAQRSASEIPEANARFSTLSISAGAEDESLGAAEGSGEQTGAEAQADAEGEGDAGKAVDEAETPPAAEGEDAGEQGAGAETSEEAAPAAEKPAADESAGSNGTESQEQQKDDEPSVDEVKTPKHAKEDDGSAPPPASTTPPKHAKPESPSKPSLNVVRDTANAFSPADKPGPSAEAGGAGDKDNGTADAGAADASAGAGSASDGGASDAA